MKTPEEVLTFFPVSYSSLSELAVGHIHKTWKVHAEEDYILQWVNPIFESGVMDDIVAVTEHLLNKGIATFRVLTTKEETLFVPDAPGFWRMFTCIPGHVHMSVTSTEVAYEAGRILGEFHHALADCVHTFRFARPLHRASKTHYALYRDAVQNAHESFDRELTDALTHIDVLPSLILPSSLRTHITHGDPKISNILFSDETQKGTAIVDLDDCGDRYNVLVDLGDALRSWCQGDEDSTESGLSVPFFRAGVEGYLVGSQDLLTAEERSLIPQAVQMITLELASRFARDIVEDNYFGWDEKRFPSRKAHNRARVLAQVSFYTELVSRKEELGPLL